MEKLLDAVLVLPARGRRPSEVNSKENSVLVFYVVIISDSQVGHLRQGFVRENVSGFRVNQRLDMPDAHTQ